MREARVVTYPGTLRERNEWIRTRRGARNEVDLDRPVAFLHEEEPDEAGRVVSVVTIFLANRECAWKCVMCDLWRNTREEKTEPGRIPAQIQHALEQLPDGEVVKLYNSGSFFDVRAIPKEDWKAIAGLCEGFKRVVVECHPLLVNERVLEFRDLLEGTLEIAMGLETAHEKALEKLNKGVTLGEFARATEFALNAGIGVRSFLLVGVPWIARAEQFDWLQRSIARAFDFGSGLVSLIPTRGGNGAMEELMRAGEFTEPVLAELEAGLEHGISLARGRVFADLWDLERFSNCEACFEARRERLARINLRQRMEPRVWCEKCDGR